MFVKNTQTGRYVELNIFDENRINWIVDFIFNNQPAGAKSENGYIESDGDGYIADTETINWWSKAVETRRYLDEKIMEVKEIIADGWDDFFEDVCNAQVGVDLMESMFAATETCEEYLHNLAL